MTYIQFLHIHTHSSIRKLDDRNVLGLQEEEEGGREGGRGGVSAVVEGGVKVYIPTPALAT